MLYRDPNSFILFPGVQIGWKHTVSTEVRVNRPELCCNCVLTKFTQQKIRRNYDILCNVCSRYFFYICVLPFPLYCMYKASIYGFSYWRNTVLLSSTSVSAWRNIKKWDFDNGLFFNQTKQADISRSHHKTTDPNQLP